MVASSERTATWVQDTDWLATAAEDDEDPEPPHALSKTAKALPASRYRTAALGFIIQSFSFAIRQK
jgi:hypothetical protein